MDTDVRADRSPSLIDFERYLTFGAGALLLLGGVSRRSVAGTVLALSSAPLLYRGVTGRWPINFNGADGHAEFDSAKGALGGARGVHVRESVRLNVPVATVYRYWRRLDNLPRFMAHLDSVTETSDGRSHWIVEGPAGLAVEWDAEIINEVENELLAWQSLPGSDVVTAGSVIFEPSRSGRSTVVRVHLQYAPPAGKAGAFVASLFGRAPGQTIREDLRRFKQQLEAGEM